MTKDTTSAVEQNNENKPADNENVVNQTADTGHDTPDNVPYARFNDMNKKHISDNKALKEQLDSIRSKQEEKKIKDTADLDEAKVTMAEQNQTIKDLTSYKEQVEEARAKEREVLLGKLSDEDKATYSNLSNKQLADHLAKSSRNVAPTDKSNAVRGSTFNPDEKNIWEMDKGEQNKNWTSYLSNFTKKK